VDPPLHSRKQTPEYGIKTPDITSQKEVQNSTIGRKSDVDTFFGCTRANLEHHQERGTTVNRVHYNEMLWDQLKPPIRTKC
jgi:hypothetical protein